MPIYEYRCRGCGRRCQVLTLRASEPPDEVCSHCGGRDLQRLLSRFSLGRSEESRLDDLASPSSVGDVDESDPRSVARWMRRVGREMGEDVGGSDFDEMVDAIESGEDDPGGDDGGTIGGSD